jgi:hypothetical protein
VLVPDAAEVGSQKTFVLVDRKMQISHLPDPVSCRPAMLLLLEGQLEDVRGIAEWASVVLPDVCAEIGTGAIAKLSGRTRPG